MICDKYFFSQYSGILANQEQQAEVITAQKT